MEKHENFQRHKLIKELNKTILYLVISMSQNRSIIKQIAPKEKTRFVVQSSIFSRLREINMGSCY